MPDPIDEIERIRADNNRLWMNILRLAVKHAPEQSKRIIATIRQNDLHISILMGEIHAGN